MPSSSSLCPVSRVARLGRIGLEIWPNLATLPPVSEAASLKSLLNGLMRGWLIPTVQPDAIPCILRVGRKHPFGLVYPYRAETTEAIWQRLNQCEVY